MVKEKLKEEIDKLNEDKQKKIADYMALIQFQSKQVELWYPYWQRTPSQRAREFPEWVSHLSKNSPSIPDEATIRDSIYR